MTVVCGFLDDAIWRIHCSPPAFLFGHGDAARHAKFVTELQKIMAVARCRRFGSAALDLHMLLLAAMMDFKRGLNSWDIAAGILLVREAGGFA